MELKKIWVIVNVLQNKCHVSMTSSRAMVDVMVATFAFTMATFIHSKLFFLRLCCLQLENTTNVQVGSCCTTTVALHFDSSSLVLKVSVNVSVLGYPHSILDGVMLMITLQ